MDEVKLPLASVIIINTKLGNDKYLRASLDSVLIQDYVNKNVVVVSNDDSDNFIREGIQEGIVDKDDEEHLIIKGKMNSVNVALIKIKKPTTVDQMRGIGVASMLNIAHIFFLLNSDSSFLKESILSEMVVEFIQFPSTVGMVFCNYLEHDVKYDTYHHQIHQQSNNICISKPALELVKTGGFADIVNIVGQRFILSYIPTTGLLKNVNIDIPKNNDLFKKMFEEVQAKIKAKQQLNDQT